MGRPCAGGRAWQTISTTGPDGVLPTRRARPRADDVAGAVGHFLGRPAGSRVTRPASLLRGSARMAGRTLLRDVANAGDEPVGRFTHSLPRFPGPLRASSSAWPNRSGVPRKLVFARRSSVSSIEMKPDRTGHPGAGPLVDEQQIGMNRPGKLNRFPLSAIKASQFGFGRRSLDFAHLDPRGELLGPIAHDGRRSLPPHFASHGAGNPHLREEPGQQVLVADFDEIAQRRRVGHNQDHRPSRPCARSFSRSARSCCKSALEYA